jgi:hypothetical protein
MYLKEIRIMNLRVRNVKGSLRYNNEKIEKEAVPIEKVREISKEKSEKFWRYN